MSKAARSVGRAVKRVVSGIGKAAKKVASSKIGKIVLAAATTYFGGPMLMGAFEGATGAATAAGMAGSAAGGGLSGALAGAGAGLSSAASGIAGAWSSLLGGNIGAAGTALADGFMGTSSAAGAAGELAGVGTSAFGNTATLPSIFGESGAGMISGYEASAAPLWGGAGADVLGVAAEPSLSFDMANYGKGIGSGQNFLTGGTSPLTTTPAKIPAPTSSGLLASIMNSPYTAPALISGGTQLVGGLLQGYGASQAQKEKLAQDEALRRQYGLNIGYDAGWKKYG